MHYCGIESESNEQETTGQILKALIEELVQMAPHDWPKFQKQLKINNIQPKTIKHNHKLNRKNLQQMPMPLYIMISTENLKSPPKIPTKTKPQRLSIHPPNPEIKTLER